MGLKLMQQRNKAIRKDFAQLCEEKPQFKVSHILNLLADKYFLEPNTIERIVKHSGNYAN